MAPYEQVEDSYEGVQLTPSCACDGEGIEVQATVHLSEAWAAHRMYVESKWADLYDACERKRADLPGLYMHRSDGLTWTEADRRKRWRAIADRKALMLDPNGFSKFPAANSTAGFAAILKDKYADPLRASLSSASYSTPLIGNEFRIPILKQATVAPGSMAASLGLDVIEAPQMEDDCIVVSGQMMERYADPVRDCYRIPLSHSEPRAGRAIEFLAENDSAPTANPDPFWKTYWKDTSAPSIITSPAVKHRYDALLKRSGIITGLGV
jgi:hypothetical protein